MAKLILTIDDIPQAVTCPMVDYLSAMEIPAVFFAVGEKLDCLSFDLCDFFVA